MKELIENLKEQLNKVIKEHSKEINQDTYWRGVKIGLETAIEVAQTIKNKTEIIENTLAPYGAEGTTGVGHK